MLDRTTRRHPGGGRCFKYRPPGRYLRYRPLRGIARSPCPPHAAARPCAGESCRPPDHMFLLLEALALEILQRTLGTGEGDFATAPRGSRCAACHARQRPAPARGRPCASCLARACATVRLAWAPRSPRQWSRAGGRQSSGEQSAGGVVGEPSESTFTSGSDKQDTETRISCPFKSDRTACRHLGGGRYLKYRPPALSTVHPVGARERRLRGTPWLARATVTPGGQPLRRLSSCTPCRRRRRSSHPPCAGVVRSQCPSSLF